MTGHDEAGCLTCVIIKWVNTLYKISQIFSTELLDMNCDIQTRASDILSREKRRAERREYEAVRTWEQVSIEFFFLWSFFFFVHVSESLKGSWFIVEQAGTRPILCIKFHSSTSHISPFCAFVF